MIPGMDKNKQMKRISEKVGRDKAVELVLQAYNTELLTTWLSRLQAAKPMGATTRIDHLGDALERVIEVVELAD